MVRKERLRFDGGGPSGYLVLAVILIIAAAVVWVSVR